MIHGKLWYNTHLYPVKNNKMRGVSPGSDVDHNLIISH